MANQIILTGTASLSASVDLPIVLLGVGSLEANTSPQEKVLEATLQGTATIPSPSISVNLGFADCVFELGEVVFDGIASLEASVEVAFAYISVPMEATLQGEASLSTSPTSDFALVKCTLLQGRAFLEAPLGSTSSKVCLCAPTITTP